MRKKKLKNPKRQDTTAREDEQCELWDSTFLSRNIDRREPEFFTCWKSPLVLYVESAVQRYIVLCWWEKGKVLERFMAFMGKEKIVDWFLASDREITKWGQPVRSDQNSMLVYDLNLREKDFNSLFYQESLRTLTVHNF